MDQVRPIAPVLVAAEVVQIIARFDAARSEAFGTAASPRFPAVTDRIDAGRWLAAGVKAGLAPSEVVSLCADVFSAVHARVAARPNARSPRSLAFHDQDMADALDRLSKPLPPGHVATTLVWWPGLAKLEAALGTVTAPMLAERTRLAAIGSSASQLALPAPDVAKSVAGPKPARTPEEIAAVNAATQAFMAERNAAIAPAAVRGVRSAHLTGEALERFRDNPLVRAAKVLQAQKARA